MERPLLRFHLAIAVRDLASTRAFYAGVLGCPEARGHDDSCTFDWFGHQLVCHVAPEQAAGHARVDSTGDGVVPARHFGALFNWDEWPRRVAALRAKGVQFLVEPAEHDHGAGGLQATCFFADPSGNVIEWKTLKEPERLFAR
ncbi:MAG: VOC family protein [Planctomycetes bacterium]|nr:VOC family protein [Planctomycetota bacterium]